MVTAALTAAAAVSRHSLHDPARNWPLTSCYVDVWIELLHGLGLDPHPALGFAVGVEWEGDQFTFLKPDTADLDALYGLQVQELAIWGDVEGHVAVQLAQDRPVLLETDAFHLPDLAGSSYKKEHSKTAIALVGIDVRAGRCSYVHNASRAVLQGADYDAVLRAPRSGCGLPLQPYAEVVKQRPRRLPASALHGTALELIRMHAARRGGRVQVPRFRAAFPRQLETLLAHPSRFHTWAFNTLRQFGAAAELLSDLLGWLEGAHSMSGPLTLGANAASLAGHAKALQFRVARLVARGRMDGCADLFDALEADEAALVKGLEACFA